jgi:hypothetical protein
MKIHINLTVEVDPEVWMLEYGVARKDVRQDVLDHLRYSVLPGLEVPLMPIK